MDANHEFIVQKDDLTGDGVFDSFKYGYLNPAGEISFDILVQSSLTSEVYKDKQGDISVSEGYQLNWKDIWRNYYIFAQRYITTNSTTTTQVDSYKTLIQKDTDSDGAVDKEVSFELVCYMTEVITIISETTHLHFRPTVNNPLGEEHDGYITEIRNVTSAYSDTSASFMIREFDSEQIISTRYYEDVFPNEISEVYDIENNLQTVTNDMGDDDPSNDIITEAPALDNLLSLAYAEDNILAIFDYRLTFEDGKFISENILAFNKTISVPGMYNAVNGLNTEDITLPVIEVIPQDGVYYDINTRYGPQKVDGKYYYYDEDGDGIYSTIFITDSQDNVIGIGMDNDYNAFFTPNRRILVEKHIVSTDFSGWEKDGNYVAQNYVDNKLIYVGDENHNDGMFLEPAFSDSLFDIWKMQYSEGSSKLIEEAMDITSDVFIESVSGRLWEDVSWQLQAAGIGVAAGLVLAGLVAYFSGGNIPAVKFAFQVGYFVGYALANTMHSWLEERDQEYWLKSQTLHNIHYDEEVVLSDTTERGADTLDVFINALLGSPGGVYAPVKVETSRHSYSGQVVLAPKNEDKTFFDIFDWDISYKALTLDYAQQTRNLMMYSDFGDPRLDEFYFEVEVREVFQDPITQTQVQTYEVMVPRFHDADYMPNSIMYLEQEIHDSTTQNNDDHYDKIIPYMVYGDGTFVPMLRFTDSEDNSPLPEYYLEYPIFVSSQQYAELSESYHSIFKIFDGYGTRDIQLIPEDSIHAYKGDVVSFKAYLVDTEGYERELDVFTDCYTYDSDTGILTLDSDEYYYFTGEIYTLLEEHSTIQNYDAYIVFDFNIEKYWDISVVREGIAPEEIDRIATMQSAHASILEYMYQHAIATQTQQRLSEITYTVYVTAISSAIL